MTFDPAAATQAYIDTLSAAELQLARDYTAGNHWLILWGLLVSALVTWLIVRSGFLVRVEEELDHRAWILRALAVAAAFLIVDGLLSAPWSVYTDWWREGQYGLTEQPLGDWLTQQVISLFINVIIGAFLLLGLYALLRKTGRWWWAWGGALVAGAAAFLLLVAPMVIEPLFNDYQPIPEGEVRDGVLALAAQAGVTEDRVFMYDGSRQSEAFTANVSGVGSSARIAISDTALGDTPLNEVLAVTGHEIGHFVSGHLWLMLAVFSLLAAAVFWLTDRLYPWFARKFGTDAAISDIRGVPVFAFLVGALLALSQPVTNTMTRIGEIEADAYSLENVGLPDALASALLKTSEYRYPLAGPVEEALLYTHPTVENRIRRAMEWKAANQAASE